MKYPISLLLIIMLCGCGIEPEDRTFVTAFAVGSGYEVAVLTSEGNVDGSNDEKNIALIHGSGSDMVKAVNDCSRKSSGELFFGHTSVCVLDKSLLENKQSLRETVNYLESSTAISRRVVIAVSDNAAELISSDNGGKTAADFVKEYYRSHKNEKSVELDRICRAIAENGDIMLPQIVLEDDTFEMKGTVLLNDGTFARELNDDESQSIGWLINGKGEYVQDCEVIKHTGEVSPNIVKIKLYLNTDDEKKQDDCRTYVKNAAQQGLEILKQTGCDIIGYERMCEIKGIAGSFNEDSEIDVSVN